MIKVLHLLSSNSFSGAEKVAISIISSLNKDVESFYVSPSGEIHKQLEKNGIKHISIENMSLFKIVKTIKKLKPEIVHAHDFRASVKIAFIPINFKKISHIHQNPPWLTKLSLYSILYFTSCLFYNRIYSVSNQIFKDTLISKIFNKKIKNAPNHIDKNEINKLARIETITNKYDLIYVGRLSNEKNPLKFIEVVNRLINEKKIVKAAIVGDGILRKDCTDLIKKLNLNDKIDFWGFILNPFPIIRSSKILVITSKWEGFGLVAVEALILGKPVIAPPVGGLINIVNNKNGALCTSENDYVKNIISILYDENVYKKKSENAKLTAKSYSKRFDWLYEYENLLNGNVSYKKKI